MAWKHAALITVLLWFAPLVVRGQAGDDDAKSRRQGLATDDRRIEALRRGDVAPLRQIYADAVVFAPGVLELCVETFGADNVLYGSDYPHTIGDMPGCLARVNGLKESARDKVRGRNAQRVFKL